MIEVTQILSRMESGDPSAADGLLPLVYEKLRKLAPRRLAEEKPGQTLQATGNPADSLSPSGREPYCVVLSCFGCITRSVTATLVAASPR